MSDVNWRIWLHNRLTQDPLITASVPVASIYGAGSLTGPPANKPFIVIQIGDEFSEFQGVSRTEATLFFHDEPGNYLTIVDLQRMVRNRLCGNGALTGAALVGGGIAVHWESDGPDQSDEGYQTLMRSSQYQLVGRNGHG